jgi:hypothetical protein
LNPSDFLVNPFDEMSNSISWARMRMESSIPLQLGSDPTPKFPKKHSARLWVPTLHCNEGNIPFREKSTFLSFIVLFSLSRSLFSILGQIPPGELRNNLTDLRVPRPVLAFFSSAPSQWRSFSPFGMSWCFETELPLLTNDRCGAVERYLSLMILLIKILWKAALKKIFGFANPRTTESVLQTSKTEFASWAGFCGYWRMSSRIFRSIHIWWENNLPVPLSNIGRKGVHGTISSFFWASVISFRCDQSNCHPEGESVDTKSNDSNGDLVPHQIESFQTSSESRPNIGNEVMTLNWVFEKRHPNVIQIPIENRKQKGNSTVNFFTFSKPQSHQYIPYWNPNFKELKSEKYHETALLA